LKEAILWRKIHWEDQGTAKITTQLVARFCVRCARVIW